MSEPRLGDAASEPVESGTTVEWGWEDFTPTCWVCSWEGVPRDFHQDAVAAARSHARSGRHQRRWDARGTGDSQTGQTLSATG